MRFRDRCTKNQRLSVFICGFKTVSKVSKGRLFLDEVYQIKPRWGAPTPHLFIRVRKETIAAIDLQFYWGMQGYKNVQVAVEYGHGRR